MPTNDVEIRVGIEQEALRRNLDRARNLITGVATSAAAAVAGVTALGVSSARSVSELSRIVDATGVGAESTQRFALALQNLGKDVDSVNDLFIDTADRIQEVRDGSLTWVEDFKLLNLEVENFIGLAPDQAVLAIAEAIENSPDEIAALAAAARILPEFQQLLPLIRGELEAVQDISILSEDEIQRAENLDRSIKSVASTFSAEFAAEFFDDLGDADSQLSEMQDLAGTLGTVLGAAADRLLTGLESSASVLNRIIDSLQVATDTASTATQISVAERELAFLQERRGSFSSEALGGFLFDDRIAEQERLLEGLVAVREHEIEQAERQREALSGIAAARATETQAVQTVATAVTELDRRARAYLFTQTNTIQEQEALLDSLRARETPGSGPAVGSLEFAILADRQLGALTEQQDRIERSAQTFAETYVDALGTALGREASVSDQLKQFASILLQRILQDAQDGIGLGESLAGFFNPRTAAQETAAASGGTLG